MEQAPPAPRNAPPDLEAIPATDVTSTGAVLNGSVNENGFNVEVLFLYKRTIDADYVEMTPFQGAAINGDDSGGGLEDDTAISLPVAGLECETSYDFLVRASRVGASSTTDSTVETFSTGGCGGGGAPEIAVSGNGQDIADGDATPDVADGTDFGAAEVGDAAVARVFVIENTGNDYLVLGGTPLIQIGGANPGDFTVDAASLNAVLAGNGGAESSTAFGLGFDPAAAGLRTAEVTISSNDADEDPFTFAVQGVGMDTMPPAVNCPADIVAWGKGGGAGVVVEFQVDASDNTAVTSLVVVPASGETYPVGQTAVTATAMDGSGNQGICGFNVTVVPTRLIVSVGPAATSESGEQAVILVRLATAPSAPVAIALSSTDTGEGVLYTSMLGFDATDWDIDKQVVVTGQDDLLRDGHQVYRVRFVSVSSADPDFNGTRQPAVFLVNRDDESGGIPAIIPALELLLDP